MRLLLDSHVLIWTVVDQARLSPAATTALEDEDNEVVISVASIWELAIKRAGGGRVGPPDVITRAGEHATIMPIEAHHAEKAATLPFIHRDPFDRMLVAQAQLEDLVLVTSDARVARYPVATMPAS